MTDPAFRDRDRPFGEKVVACARGWIGTPYEHQASCKGAGTDCLGLLRGVWRELVGDEPERVPPYTGDWSEPSRTEDLWAAASRHLVPVRKDRLEIGDVLLLRMRDGSVAKHVGFLATDSDSHRTIIHAYSGHGVVESALTPAWADRVVAAFHIPDRRQ